ncbi:MAG: hypothetical protein DMG98_20795 [Acidobacteria bacterium]|jgi:hypothetical protein|nr:MAG: hypothetical protein DMG98_20795 [Acidobacteriota bacterium]
MPNKRLQFPMPSKIRSLATILWAGLIAGGLDITAAFAVYGFFGLKPMRLLQGIAGGLLGPRTFEGGLATAFLGLLCQFLIAFSVAAVYFAMSRGLPFLVEHAVISGFVYGAAVYFFMNRIVVPLSAATKYPFSFKMMFIGVVIHMFCVGLPISLMVRRFSR